MGLELAFLFPHPPLAVPEVGRGKEAEIQNTLDAFDAAAREIAAASPDTVIFITPHSAMYADYFHISPGKGAKGDLGRFAAGNVRFEARYDGELISAIIRLAEQGGIEAGFLGEKEKALDHGTMIPMWFINRHFDSYMTVRISQSGMGAAEHYHLGQLIARAAEESGRRAVLIASGDLSHKLTADGSYGYSPGGPEFDKRVTRALADGDFSALFSISDGLRESAAECGYGSIMTLAGCFDRRGVEASLLSYEGPFGVGYAVARFFAGKPDGDRAFLDIYEKGLAKEREERIAPEDPFCSLARASLEYTLKHGEVMPLPDGLDAEMTEVRAGVFVSFHRDSQLRGCIGTISPTTNCVAAEIIQNAVSAGLEDSRFSPVSAKELSLMDCKVDVLMPPEAVADESELDVKRFGVIVSSGFRRGLLLPDLEGVDSVKQQISIAKSKAGISESAPVKLERFEVIRHE